MFRLFVIDICPPPQRNLKLKMRHCGHRDLIIDSELIKPLYNKQRKLESRSLGDSLYAAMKQLLKHSSLTTQKQVSLKSKRQHVLAALDHIQQGLARKGKEDWTQFGHFAIGSERHRFQNLSLKAWQNFLSQMPNERKRRKA